MSPHDSVGTKKAVDSDELYNSLNQTGQDVWDLIGSKGFRPDQNAEKQWIALDTNGDDIVGPCESLSALASAVDAHIAGKASPSVEDEADSDETADETFTLTNDEDKPKKHKVKQSLLPGTENAVMQDLRNAILGYRATTMDIIDLQARQKEEKKLVLNLMHKFEDELSTDKETGFKFIQVETVRAIIEITETETLKTEKVDL